ncbi:hypothetical protein TRFO_36717 [Tritrichomonas foetus]|uniref:Leucine Rich Repeat family protein n=1 Tax=Tritrichomonas foetus TaxID=1144522 RepID=A0A1J4JFS1_9EUKA|nr:hypothetical protein TRFO_36717 [Tritrichomonas foetus]|eukprot:OHS97135.1 hypothetical protein TRFO_36717 [Tritrichomonas foetus]
MNDPKIRSHLLGLLKIQRANLSSRGILDFSNQNIRNLTGIGNQKCLKTLILNGTPLKTFESIPPQQNLQVLKANDSNISSFVGLSRHPQLKSISLKNTPISNIENFRLSCIIVCDKNLTEINGIKISKTERALARKYPPIARFLIEDGWKVVVPPPSVDEMRQIAIDHDLTIQDVDPDFTNDAAEQYLRIPMTLSTRKTHQSSDDEYIFEEELMSEEELVDNLIDVLGTIGLKIPRDEGARDDIIDAIDMLSVILQDLRPSE